MDKISVGAGAILGVVISGVILASGAAIFENAKATATNLTKIESFTKEFEKYESRIMDRFDKLEDRLNVD